MKILSTKVLIISCTIALGAFGAIALFVMTQNTQTKNVPSDEVARVCQMDAKLCPDGSAVVRGGPRCEFAACPPPLGNGLVFWEFLRLADRGDGVPLTEVSLVYEGNLYALGAFEGSCSEIARSSWTPLPNETSAAICWFAGGGVELGVFLENNRYVVKKGQLDEGDAENPGVRGGFQSLVTLK